MWIVVLVAIGILTLLFWYRSQSPSMNPATSQTNQTNKPVEEGKPFSGKVSDMANGEMKEVKAGNETVLLIKDNDKFCAVGNKCSHYGVSLKGGSYYNGSVRCPAHGACFSTTTGDIEDCPGSNAIPVYEVQVNGEDVIVSGKKLQTTSKKLTKFESKPVYAIIGAGGAGYSAAFALREFGFKGKIVLIGSESHLAYDRPKLSKNLSVDVSKILLSKQADYDAAEIEVRVATVKELNALTKEITLVFGEKNDSMEMISYDKCLLATGATPNQLRMIKGNENPGSNVYFLRTIEDANRIGKDVKGKNVLILGSSFIGIETASCIINSAKQVTVNGFEKVPFERVLGLEIGGILQKMHEDKKVLFKMNAGVIEFQKNDDVVHTVCFNDGTQWSGDMIIIGAGALCNTGYIKDNGAIKFAQDKSIIVDQYLNCGPDSLFAAGDIANCKNQLLTFVRFPLPLLDNDLVRIEHWGYAMTQGRCAARNMIQPESDPMKAIPFFWTTAYGMKTVRYAGYGMGVDEIIIDMLGEKSLNPSDPKFIAYYGKAGKLIAIASQSSLYDNVVARVAQLWKNDVYLSMAELREPVQEGKSFDYVLTKMRK